MSFLTLENIEAGYEKRKPILNGFNLAIEQGKLVSLLGPSGCGKRTTLRTIARFIAPTRGRITIADKDYTRRPPHKRNIGLVFQNYALFPHLSVYNNVAFGLKKRRRPRAKVNERVLRALKSVGMAGFEDRLPAQLSGGQPQCVALARAIVIRPNLLLLDEPLSNLDAKLRVEMRAELRRLQQQLNITMLYVTHDQAEALSLSDWIVVMNQGLIEQMGPPEEIYQRPATVFVARFMGLDNWFEAQLTQVEGRAAHAVNPEDGINAIKAIGAIAAALPTGQIDADSIANLGKIEGGGVINAVPDRALLVGEARSLRADALDALCGRIAATAVSERRAAGAGVAFG